MQRQVLVLLVTFDLWVSLLVSVFPCLFLDLVVFCFRWLAGLRLGARRYLLLQRLGGRGPCPPARALLPQCLPQASGSDSGLAAPTPPDPWLRTRVSGLGRSSGRVGDTVAILGLPLLPCLRLWPWVGTLQGPRSHCGCPGDHSQAAPSRLPSERVRSTFSGPGRSPALSLQASLEPQHGKPRPTYPAPSLCCGAVLPGQSQVASGPTWGAPPPAQRPRGLHGARQGLQSLGPGPAPPVPQNLLAAPSLGFLPPPLGSVSSRDCCSARGGAPLGAAPASRQRQPVSQTWLGQLLIAA